MKKDSVSKERHANNILKFSYYHKDPKMHLFVRGSTNHIIKFDECKSFSHLLEIISIEENCGNVCIYQSGRPILDLDQIKTEDNMILPIDVNVPLKGGKVSLSSTTSTIPLYLIFFPDS